MENGNQEAPPLDHVPFVAPQPMDFHPGDPPPAQALGLFDKTLSVTDRTGPFLYIRTENQIHFPLLPADGPNVGVVLRFRDLDNEFLNGDEFNMIYQWHDTGRRYTRLQLNWAAFAQTRAILPGSRIRVFYSPADNLYSVRIIAPPA